MFSLRTLIALIPLLCLSFFLKGQQQVYESVLKYNDNSHTTHGTKIKTNIPFVNYRGMQTLMFEGYAYNQAKTIGIKLSWYVYREKFHKHTASSDGGFAPPIKLGVYDDNGQKKVIIFIEHSAYYLRFNVRAFARGLSAQDSWFTSWSATDEPFTTGLLPGSDQADVEYTNEVGKLVAKDNAVVSSNGRTSLVIQGPKDAGGGAVADLKFIATGGTVGNTGSNNWIWSYRTGSWADSPGDLVLYSSKAGEYTSPIIAKSNGDLLLGAGRNSPRKGSIGIGLQEIPTGYKLAVNGKIIAKGVKVAVPGTGNWSDYVFDPTYQLMPLSEVEQYIIANKHLPDVPSAKEVVEQGIDMAEMDATLLQKIEELTLYAIEQEKKLSSVSKELGEARRERDALKKELSLLKKMIIQQQSNK